jgi:hypothetical protein
MSYSKKIYSFSKKIYCSISNHGPILLQIKNAREEGAMPFRFELEGFGNSNH